MPINFDKALGIHPQALTLRARRSEVLAANMANADTPGFKARDIDFKSVLSKVSPDSLAMKVTSPGHLSAASGSVMNERLLYRIPLQPALDGNTVDSHIEQAKFAENAVQYQASLQFLGSKISGLKSAIKGE